AGGALAQLPEQLRSHLDHAGVDPVQQSLRPTRQLLVQGRQPGPDPPPVLDRRRQWAFALDQELPFLTTLLAVGEEGLPLLESRIASGDHQHVGMIAYQEQTVTLVIGGLRPALTSTDTALGRD